MSDILEMGAFKNGEKYNVTARYWDTARKGLNNTYSRKKNSKGKHSKIASEPVVSQTSRNLLEV